MYLVVLVCREIIFTFFFFIFLSPESVMNKFVICEGSINNQ